VIHTVPAAPARARAPRALTLAAAALLALAGVSATAGAQQQPTVRPRPVGLVRLIEQVPPGAKIRLATLSTPPMRIEGRLVRVAPDSVLVRPDGASDTRVVRTSTLLFLEEGYKDRKRGALLGVIPPLVAVYAWDFFGPHPRYADQGRRYMENAAAAAIGGGIGAAVGASIGWQRWRAVRVIQ
jgi:hypothetical protein